MEEFTKEEKDRVEEIANKASEDTKMLATTINNVFGNYLEISSSEWKSAKVELGLVDKEAKKDVVKFQIHQPVFVLYNAIAAVLRHTAKASKLENKDVLQIIAAFMTRNIVDPPQKIETVDEAQMLH